MQRSATAVRKGSVWIRGLNFSVLVKLKQLKVILIVPSHCYLCLLIIEYNIRWQAL